MPSRDQRVAQAFRAITSALGPGIHYIVVSAHLDETPEVLVAAAEVEVTGEAVPGIPSVEFGDVLGDAIFGVLGRVVAGTYGPRGTCVVRGWLVAAGWFHAMGATETLNAPRVMPHGCLTGDQPGLSFEDGCVIPRARPQPPGPGAVLP
jgi:hypothetical protein